MMTNKITVVCFYKFVDLPNFADLQQPIKNYASNQKIKGTILLSKEGINSTIAGTNQSIMTMLEFLRNYPQFKDLTYKLSQCDTNPFIRLKVKLKKEIVTLGIKNINPSQATGQYVAPADWNQLIADPDVITIDTRNKYEVKIGSFDHAINPKTDSFREFPEFFAKNFQHLDRKQKIAMFCTGGIRCEKSTAYLMQLGFTNVYHLQGGILNYLEQIPPQDSLWQGECFVFDNRIGVNHHIQPSGHSMCPGCRYPVSNADKQSTRYKEGVYCPICIDTIPKKTIKRAEARHRQKILAKQKSNDVSPTNLHGNCES